MPASKSARSVQFGAFRLNLRELELTKHGRKIRVPDQSLQILAVLLEFPGEMVTREELHARLWPNGTIVEFEHSINSAIRRLRAALGDSAEKPRFIETLPRRGYRFIFPIEQPVSDEFPETVSLCHERGVSRDFAGQEISHYRVFEKVGQGAMGVVYKAEDLRLGRTVALKFLTEELSTDPKAQERFQREARATSALNHRNICTIYEVDEQDGRLLIAMEYVAGKPLDQFVGPNPLSVDELVSYAVQATDALAAAHAAGIIHRDVKPSNIMVGADGQLKVLDFGLAKIEHREPKAWQTLTNPGVVMGTVRYMSPEQALGREVDRRSDIFSLGVVLYELATGQPPFPGDSSPAIIDAILHSVPTPLRRLNPRLSPHMARIIEKALNKDPNLRYKTAGEMRADLERAIRSPKWTSEANVVRKNRLKWLIALASLVLIATLASRWRFVRAIPTAGADSRIVPLTSDPGFQESPALSPDGKRVAYTWDGEKGNNSDIYVKAVDGGGGPLRLTTDPAYDGGASWSPDGRNIAFGRRRQDHIEILSVPAFGGPERKLGETRSNGISWSPDGKFLAVVDQETPDKPLSISLLSIETGEKRRLTSPPRDARDELPKFAPDGRSLAFLRLRNLMSADLYVLSLAATGSLGEPRRLTFDDQADIWGLDWTSDGRNIVFSSWGPGRLSPSLWSIPAAGGTPQRLPLTGENASSLSIARAGNRLVYTHGIGGTNMRRIPGPTSSEKTAPPIKLITSKQSDREPTFSPDGSRSLLLRFAQAPLKSGFVTAKATTPYR
jgi:serine/threonine protein kinase